MRHKIRHVIFGILIAFSITTASAVKKEPLTDHVALFNEMDVNLRTADPSTNAINYVIWMETAIEAKRDLRQHKQIEPWLKELSTTCSNNWRVLRATALGYRKVPRSNSRTLRNKQARLMDRAYQLAREDATPEELSRLIDDYIGILFSERTSSRYLNLKTINIPVSEIDKTYEQFREHEDKDVIVPPVFHPVPASYEAALNDGEIIRWLLANKPTSGYEPLEDSRNWTMADFAVAFAGTHHNVPDIRYDNNDPTVYKNWRNELHRILFNLEDKQSLKWGNGCEYDHLVIDLPEDYQYIHAYKNLADNGDLQAAATLGNIFLNRSQLERAAEWYLRAGRTNEAHAIRANQGRLTQHLPQLAGTPQSIFYNFRNGSAVDCSIHPINQGEDLLPRLMLGKVMGSEMKLLEGNPSYFHKFNSAEQDGAIGPAITNWSVALSPAPHHLDAKQTIEIPALDAGFYLLKATMQGGNPSTTVLHIFDTLMLSANSNTLEENNEVLILCNALNGAPLTNEPLHFIDASAGIRREDRKDFDGPVKLAQYLLKQTDSNGLLVTTREKLKRSYDRSGERRRMEIIAFANRTHPFLARNNTTGLSAYSRRYRDEKWTGDPRIFLSTDRPVYRPGDTGHLKYWIPGGDAYRVEKLELVHEETDETLTLTANPEPDENGDILLDEFGGCDFDFTIPSNAPLGSYQCRKMGSSRYGSDERAYFDVEEYRAPELLLDVALTDDGKIQLAAKHAYGKPLANGTLHGSARFQHAAIRHYYPPAPLDPVWNTGYWWNGNQFASPRTATPPEEIECNLKFEFELNTEGTATIDPSTATNGTAALATPGFFSVYATIIDSTGKEEDAEGIDIPTPPTIAPKLCCWLDNAFYALDAPIICHIAHDPQLTPDRIEIRETGNPDQPPFQSLEIDTGESCALKPLPAGLYDVQLISRSGETSQPFQFAVGAVTATDLSAEHPIRVVVEKGAYQEGDTARVMIQADRPGRYVYLFPAVSDQFGFATPQVIHMEHTSQIVEIQFNDAAMDRGILRCAALTIEKGKTYITDQTIRIVSSELDAGTVELTPDKKSYAPGEEVALSIKTLASDGTPRPSSVTVTVYNEALDFWAYWWRVPDLIQTLFATWRDVSDQDVSTRDAFTRRLYAINPHWAMKSIVPKGEPPFLSFLENMVVYGGLGGIYGSAMDIAEETAFKDSAPPSSLQVREDFRDLAYWNATILTDSNGIANVTFPMPDGLVKWKIQAWAMHTNYAATVTGSITCTKDFVAHLHTPRFMRVGDALTLSTTVRNHTTNTLAQIAANITEEGIEVKSAANAKILGLNPGVEANIDWDLYAAESGNAMITTKAWNDVTSDGMKKTFPVLPRGMRKRGGRGGVLAGNKTSETITIGIPEEIDPESIDGQLNVSPNMIDALANALPFLQEYPHGCAEQTLNRFLPALIVMSTMEELGITVTNRSKLIEHANKGVKKLLDAANYRDEWGWNLDKATPRDAFISSWITRGLRISMATSELSISSGAPENATEYILSNMSKRLECPPGSTNAPALFNIHALQALVASEFNLEKVNWYNNERGGKVSTEDKQRVLADYSNLLLANADQLSLYGKVLLALAFELQDDAKNRDQLIAYIDQYLDHDAETGASWLRTGTAEYWFWYNDDIETQAWYLKLLNRVDPQSERAAGIARHLMLNRVHGDHWKSTRDTAIAVEALAEFTKNNQPKPGEAKPVITLNGTNMADLTAVRLTPGVNMLTITSPSGAPLFHDVTWSYYSIENPITAETCGLVTIDRKYFRAAEQKEDRVEVKVGESIAIGERVEVELTIDASQHLEYLLAEDFKPAGFETYDQASGYWDGAYRELHDERVSFYLNRIRKGKTTLSYEMRAEFAGTLSAHPATIELMYAPRQAANSVEREFTIER